MDMQHGQAQPVRAATPSPNDELGVAGDDRGQAPERFERKKQTLAVRFGKRIRDPVNRWFARQSLIGNDPFVDPALLPQLEPLKRNWEAIRAELMPLLAERTSIPAFGEISPDHRRIAPTAAWKSFFFEGYGLKAPANRARCPRTAALLDEVPGLVVAFFSIMEPGIHVPRHRGLTKAWLNCHLGLAVPQGPQRCEIQVGEEFAQWREGEWMVFDETNEHEVWNDSREPRVVLFLQVMRPMRWPGRLVARIIHGLIRRSSFVQDVKREIGI